MIRFVIFLFVFVVFQPSPTVAQQPPISLEKRIELAKKLIAEDRAAAIEDPSAPERAYLFTQTNALIDPQWTADFIIANTIKGHSGSAYENKTIVNLLKHPEELTEKQVLELVGYYPFLSSNYIRMALHNLPDDPKFDSVKKKLIEEAIDALNNTTPNQLVFGIFSPTNNAHLPEDPEFEERIQKKIDDFFVSGKVEEIWKGKARGQKMGAYNIARLKELAPEGFDLGFLGEAGANSVALGFELQVLNDPFLSSEEKSNWLKEKTEIQFGDQPHEARTAAMSMGLVAEHDYEKAIAWAESGESPVIEILAKLSIAPVLARTDKSAAINLVRQCYEDCANLDPRAAANRSDLILLNTAPVQIATTGLKVAKHLDADLLAECLETTLDLIKIEMKPSKEYARPGRLYRSLAAVSRYDRKAAKALFDIVSVVELGSDSDFFVALVAIDPDRVWDKYSALPSDDEEPAKPRFRSRQAIATALVQRNEDDFWLQLDRYYYMEFPKSIFEP